MSDLKFYSLRKPSIATIWILLAYSLVTMMSLIIFGGMPETAQEGFSMFTENRLVGLLRMDVLTIFIMPLYYLLILGLFTALKKTNYAMSLLGALIGVAGVTLVLATPSVFSFMTLSDKFAASNNLDYENLILAAGESILATDLWHGSGALIGGILLQTSTLLFSILMIRTPGFTRVTAWLGVVMHGLDLLHIVVGLFLPSLGAILLIIAGPLYLVWFPLLARDFHRLAKENN